MSDRDFLDLDEDLLDDGADAPVGGWDDDLMDDFPADDPAARDEVAAPTAAAVEPVRQEKKQKQKKSPGKPPPRRRSGGGGTGVLCFVLVMLSGLTLASGLMTAVGAAPEALLDFSGFQDPATITDFQANPINAFWLAAGVTLLAAVMTGVAVSRRMSGVTSSSDSQDDVLDAIRHLDPEKPETWRREELQSDPELADVTSALLGHYNLQQAKLDRYMGVEGELHRLEKALVDESQADLKGSWDNPAVGSLADQALRLLQLHEEASQDANQSKESIAEQGADLVSGLRDARSWQTATLDQVKHQGSGIERIFRRLGKLAADGTDGTDGGDDATRRERLRQGLIAVRQELEALPARASGDGGGDSSLVTLVERASRLAFQIAMEVARLGPKGERLLPLTQDLEELTTELRAVTDRGRSRSGEDEARDRALEKVRGRLAELDPAVLESAGDERAVAVAELAPLAGEVAAGLANLAKNFGVQDHRIRQMLELASTITGIEVGEGGDPDAAPGSGMLVDNYDPFSSGSGGDGGLVADPFASRQEHSIFDTDAPQSEDFARTVLPGQEEQLQTPPEPSGDLGLLSSDELMLGDEPAAIDEPAALDEPAAPATPSTPFVEETPVAGATPPDDPLLGDLGDHDDHDDHDEPSSPANDSPLPPAEEKVYDLSEFDAQALQDEQPAAQDDGERIYELSELGAVKVG